MKKYFFIRYFFKIFFYLLMTATVLFSLIQLSWVQRQLWTYVASTVLSAYGLKADIEKVSGILPFYFSIESFRLSSLHPVLKHPFSVQIQDLNVKINAKKLWQESFNLSTGVVRSVHAKRVIIQNLNSFSTLSKNTQESFAESQHFFYTLMYGVLSQPLLHRLSIQNLDVIDQANAQKFSGQIDHQMTPNFLTTRFHMGGQTLFELKAHLDRKKITHYTLFWDDTKKIWSLKPISLKAQLSHDPKKANLHLDSCTCLWDGQKINFQGDVLFQKESFRLKSLFRIQSFKNPLTVEMTFGHINRQFSLLDLLIEEDQQTLKKTLIKIKSPKGVSFLKGYDRFKGQVLVEKVIDITWGDCISLHIDGSLALKEMQIFIDSPKYIQSGKFFYDFKSHILSGSGHYALSSQNTHPPSFRFDLKYDINSGHGFLNGDIEEVPLSDYLLLKKITFEGKFTNYTQLIFALKTGENPKYDWMMQVTGLYDIGKNQVKIQPKTCHYQNFNFVLSPHLEFNFLTDKGFVMISPFLLKIFQNEKNLGEISWSHQEKTLQIKNLNLHFLRIFKPHLGGTARVNGFCRLETPLFMRQEDWHKIDLKTQLRFDQFYLYHVSPKSNQTIQNFCFESKFHLEQKNLKIDLQQRDGKKQLFSVQGNCHLLKLFEKSMPTQDAFFESLLDLKMKGKMQLALINSFFSMPDRLEGDLIFDLIFKGTPKTPHILGHIDIEHGVYDSFINGTYIAGLRGRLKANGGRFTIEKMTGSDQTPNQEKTQKTHFGTVEITGSAGLSFDHIFDLDLRLTLNNLNVVRRDDMTIQGSGTIFIKGQGLKSLISGSVTLSPAVIYLEELTDDDIATILIKKDGKILATKKQQHLKLVQKKREKDPLFPINLQLKLGQQFLIVGKGIKSLWSGDMQVLGDFSGGIPYLFGKIFLSKGRVDFFGKKMKIVQAEIQFDDVDENNPYVYLKAHKKIENYDLFMILKGRANDNDFSQKTGFSFTSTPPLTQESVLSMLLFEKKAQEIGAGQSIQLAMAAATLNAKRNQSLNILEKFKATLGFDIFELKENAHLANTSDTGQTAAQSLVIGKEIDDFKIYYDQGFGENGKKITISKEIGHNFQFDVDAGDKVAGSGIGLSWVRQY